MPSFLDQPLGQIARELAGATAVLHECKLDFCCHGDRTLREAAGSAGLDAEAIAQRLQGLQPVAQSGQPDWAAAPQQELIAHLLERFHEVHRVQFPKLIRLARRVEQVHGQRQECPAGLADHLCEMEQALESHMQKEELILFPMIQSGAGARTAGPIHVMRMEHDDHGMALQRLAALTDDITPPQNACTTWRALYTGLRTMRDDLLQHIHLENNILFPNVQSGQNW